MLFRNLQHVLVGLFIHGWSKLTHGYVHGEHCCREQSENERIPQLQVFFYLYRCVATSCVHACSPQIITMPKKDHFLLQAICWIKCWFYRCSYCIRINFLQKLRASCGHCRASSCNSSTHTCSGSCTHVSYVTSACTLTQKKSCNSAWNIFTRVFAFWCPIWLWELHILGQYSEIGRDLQLFE